MANLAVLASGNGSNFEAIATRVLASRHRLCCLVCDRKQAYAFERASRLGVPSFHVSYRGRERSESEQEILELLDGYRIDLIALAGFMRLLTPLFVDAYPDRIVNIHPSLLPAYPGTHAILEAYEAGDEELGITVHRVDHGMDTGPIIVQKSFRRGNEDSLEQIEQRIHELEHATYPRVVLAMLDELEKTKHPLENGERRVE